LVWTQAVRSSFGWAKIDAHPPPPPLRTRGMGRQAGGRRCGTGVAVFNRGSITRSWPSGTGGQGGRKRCGGGGGGGWGAWGGRGVGGKKNKRKTKKIKIHLMGGEWGKEGGVGGQNKRQQCNNYYVNILPKTQIGGWARKKKEKDNNKLNLTPDHPASLSNRWLGPNMPCRVFRSTILSWGVPCGGQNKKGGTQQEELGI